MKPSCLIAVPVMFEMLFRGAWLFSFWFSALGMPWIVGKTMITCTFVGLGRLLGTRQVRSIYELLVMIDV